MQFLHRMYITILRDRLLQQEPGELHVCVYARTSEGSPVNHRMFLNHFWPWGISQGFTLVWRNSLKFISEHFWRTSKSQITQVAAHLYDMSEVKKMKVFYYKYIINALWSLWKQFLHVHVLPGTSAGAGWSPSGWRPVAAGCWATGRAARHLWGPEPGHKPAPHTQNQTEELKEEAWRLQVCNRTNRHLTCALSHITRWLSGRTRQSINHAAHCRHNSIFVFWKVYRQTDRWVRDPVSQQEYF